MAPITKYRKCVVCGKRWFRLNGDKRKFMAKFPLDEDRCRQWVKNIGNEDLAYIPIEKLHDSKYVCGDHFQSNDFNKKKSRLKKWAVPSILMNMPSLSDHLLAEFPCHMRICETCRKNLQAEDKTDQVYKFISLKEWDENTRLTYPSIALCNEVKSLTKIFDELIKGMLHVTGITQYSQTIMLGYLNTSWLCKDHFPVLSEKLVHLLSLLLIRNECRKINESYSLSEDASADILKKAQQGGTAK